MLLACQPWLACRRPTTGCFPNADGLALIDVRAKPWPVLYANDTFAQASRQGVEDCTQQGFWDQFEPVEGDSVGLHEQYCHA